MTAVALLAVTKRYGRSGAGVQGVTLDVPAAGHLVVVGPSGAGKTTLLRLVAGLETPDAGDVLIAGQSVRDVPPHRRDVGWLGQRPALYPHLSVADNLAAPLRLSRGWWRRGRVPESDVRARVADAAARLQLGSLLNRRPHELSGGEQQRAALGRLWVARPAVWLLDEPFAHLDRPLRDEIRRALGLLAGEAGRTILEVTHDPAEARSAGRRVAVVQAGRLDQVGPPDEVYAFPRTRTVAGLLGWPPMNFIAGAPGGNPDDPRLAADTQGEGFALPATLPAPPGTRLTLGVRPEALAPAAVGPGPHLTLGVWTATTAEPFGPLWLVTCERGDARWRVWLPDRVPAGAAVPLVVPWAACHWFDAAGLRLDHC